MTTTTTEKKPTTAATFDPWKTIKLTYMDELLKPEYADRQLKLTVGPNWMRILPAEYSGSEAWLLGLHVLATPTGKFAHPLTFEAGARSVWDATYGYLRKTDPGKLYCRASPNGLRLLPNPMALCFAIVGHGSENGTPLAVRLLMLSGYSGERGGTPGLGYQLYSMAQDRDENGDLAHNILGEADGVQINIEKIVTEGGKYPRYVLRAGRQPCPISELIARLMPASEVATIRAAIER